MKISLEALEVLDAIDTRGSFAAAASALHRVPSALTHTVKKLENDLGVALFLRQGRRASLTPAGALLLAEGRHLLRAAGELECRVKRVATGWENELRIAVDAVLACPALVPLLAKFYREPSGTRLRLTCEVLGGCWDALFSGRADLAIAAPGDMPPSGGVRTRPFGSVDFVFVVAANHPLARLPEPLAPSTIRPHRVIAVADSSRQLLARSSGLLSGQDVLTVPDTESKLAALRAGLGVGHLPRHQAQRALLDGTLVVREVTEPKPTLPLYLAWRSDHQGKALSWFLDRLPDEALRALLHA